MPCTIQHVINLLKGNKHVHYLTPSFSSNPPKSFDSQVTSLNFVIIVIFKKSNREISFKIHISFPFFKYLINFVHSFYFLQDKSLLSYNVTHYITFCYFSTIFFRRGVIIIHIFKIILIKWVNCAAVWYSVAYQHFFLP